jgi:hypothetical protein
LFGDLKKRAHPLVNSAFQFSRFRHTAAKNACALAALMVSSATGPSSLPWKAPWMCFTVSIFGGRCGYLATTSASRILPSTPTAAPSTSLANVSMANFESHRNCSSAFLAFPVGLLIILSAWPSLAEAQQQGFAIEAGLSSGPGSASGGDAVSLYELQDRSPVSETPRHRECGRSRHLRNVSKTFGVVSEVGATCRGRIMEARRRKLAVSCPTPLR